MMYSGYGTGMGWGMIFFAVALTGLLLVIIALLFGQFRPKPAPPTSPGPSAEAERTLADRLARGEIDTEEYDQRLRALRAATRN